MYRTRQAFSSLLPFTPLSNVGKYSKPAKTSFFNGFREICKFHCLCVKTCIALIVNYAESESFGFNPLTHKVLGVYDHISVNIL